MEWLDYTINVIRLEKEYYDIVKYNSSGTMCFNNWLWMKQEEGLM